MRNKFFTFAAALALVGIIHAAPAIAEDGGMEMGMDKMNMESMQGMMHECKNMNKDGKMCDKEMMQKCQKDLSNGECSKMMKQAKTQDSIKTK